MQHKNVESTGYYDTIGYYKIKIG